MPETVRNAFGEAALLAHVAEWAGSEELKESSHAADAQFFLDADGQRALGVACDEGGETEADGSLLWIVIRLGADEWRDFTPGVRYAMRARNSNEGSRWNVAQGLTTTRATK